MDTLLATGHYHDSANRTTQTIETNDELRLKINRFLTPQNTQIFQQETCDYFRQKRQMDVILSATEAFIKQSCVERLLLKHPRAVILRNVKRF